MKLHDHSIHFVRRLKTDRFIQRKADKLDTLMNQIIDGEVFMR